MKFKTTSDTSEHLHVFLYSDPGAGKTKAIADFHQAGQDVVLVTTEQDGPIPLKTRGINAPVLVPEEEDDLLAIISQPEAVIEKVIQKQPGFENYAPKTFAFDGLRALQRVVLGHTPSQERDALDGAVTIPGSKDGSGVMRVPSARPAPGVPAPKDYRLLDLRMRNLVAGIEKMPFHTIITAHYEKDFDIETRLSLTGDQKTDKDVNRMFRGFPSLEGYSLKYDLPGLCSSFYLYLKESNGRYQLIPKATPSITARTRVAEVMPQSEDWTNKNLYEFLQGKIDEATKKLSPK